LAVHMACRIGAHGDAMTAQETNPEVTVVIPCLNEAETLGACIRKAQAAIRRNDLRAEIVVADNGSHDGSPEIARALGARVVHAPVRGYGAALTAGIEAAKGTYVVMGDADDSYDFSAIFPFIEKLREGYDLVMGCRLPRGGGKILPGAMPWSHRRLGNPALSRLGRAFFHNPVSDFYCGLRAFRRDAIAALDLRTTGMEFAPEMVIKAVLRHLRIAEIPITLHKDGRSRPPHLRRWRDGWRGLRFMLMYSPNWLFLIPGCVLFLLGATAGGVLLAGPVRIGSIGFDTNTLLVCAMAVLVGFKLIVFAMFAKLFAVSEGLLPEDPRFAKAFRVITLEVGLVFGLVVALAGFGLLYSGFLFWERHHFGPLSYPDSLRLIIPGVTCLTLGVETVFSSFFLSVLGLARK
jgi:glycosyltransferase involved in cell wall biosynthesis